jgi:PhnB protein
LRSGDGPASRAVSPCLLVDSIEDEVRFLKAVFHVTVYEGERHEKTIWQLEAKLGDTTLKIGRAQHGGASTNSVLYVWTADVDGTYARAIEAGATLISEPTDQPWGVREAGFRGPQGDIWWIGERRGRLSNREVEEKLRRQRKFRM